MDQLPRRPLWGRVLEGEGSEKSGSISSEPSVVLLSRPSALNALQNPSVLLTPNTYSQNERLGRGEHLLDEEFDVNSVRYPQTSGGHRYNLSNANQNELLGAAIAIAAESIRVNENIGQIREDRRAEHRKPPQLSPEQREKHEMERSARAAKRLADEKAKERASKELSLQKKQEALRKLEETRREKINAGVRKEEKLLEALGANMTTPTSNFDGGTNTHFGSESSGHIVDFHSSGQKSESNQNSPDTPLSEYYPYPHPHPHSSSSSSHHPSRSKVTVNPSDRAYIREVNKAASRITREAAMAIGDDWGGGT